MESPGECCQTASVLPRTRIAGVLFKVYVYPSASIIFVLVERFTEGTELMGAAEVQLQSDLIR